MATGPQRSGSGTRLPLKRQHGDRVFWARLAALWHRERMREVYARAGETSAAARHRANREALDVARDFGLKLTLPQLKSDLAELVVNGLPQRGKADPARGIRYWEEQVHVDILNMLAEEPQVLRSKLQSYVEQDVLREGEYYGRTGFYKLTHIVGYTPSLDHLEHRTAFLDALHAIGHDPQQCDREVYKVVLRLLRDYTRRPFETRLGISMPSKKQRRLRRRLFGFLQPRP